MGAQRPSANQAGICPSQCLLQSTPVSGSTQLGSTALRRCQAAVEADGQHQPDRGALRGGELGRQAVSQTAATASSAAGDISNCGASA